MAEQAELPEPAPAGEPAPETAEKQPHDILPFILGNQELKEILLYSMCRYDEKNPKHTIPIVFIGKSGEGKTAILECIASLYPSKLYTKDGLTEAGLSELKMSRKILCMDELTKWSVGYLAAVVLLFSHSETERSRKGKQTKIVANGLPVATVLDTWREQASDVRGLEDKKFIIAQIMRRSALLEVQPTTRDPVIHDLYVTSVFADIFGVNKKDALDIKELRRSIFEIIDRAGELNCYEPDIASRDEYTLMREYTNTFRSRIEIDPLVSYDQEFPKILANLAVGRAFALGRKSVSAEDIRRVGDILTRNAQALKFWKYGDPKVA